MSTTSGLVLAEALQLDGGVITAIALALVAMFAAFIAICWGAYRAGAGSRAAQVVVGMVLAFMVAIAVTSGGRLFAPGVIFVLCAVAGRSQAKK